MKKEITYTIDTDNTMVESYCEEKVDIEDVAKVMWQNMLIMKMNDISMDEALSIVYKTLFNAYGIEDFVFEGSTNELNLN